MGECLYSTCNRDHPYTEGYLYGCPYEGQPGRLRRQQEEPLSVEQRLHYERLAWQAEQRAVEQRTQRRRAIEAAKLAVLRREWHAQRDAEREAAMAQVHDIVKGVRFVEGYDERQRVKQLATWAENLRR
jgi:hypothetical protein